jgi:F-type H+-transporting ATPase subunit b
VLIDWYTVAAQAVNFLILVALLKVFLFDRVVKVMDKRQQSIDDRLREAEEGRERAEELQQKLEQEKQRLERNRDEQLQKAKQEADARREELLEQVREEVRHERESWQASLERERENLDRELASALARGVLDVSGKALRDLADEDLLSRITERFLKELEEIGENERDTLAKGAEEDHRIEIATPFELPAESQKRVSKAVADKLQTDVETVFEQSPETFGMILSAGGRRFGWDLHRYFEQLSKKVDGLLASRMRDTQQPGNEGEDADG